MKWRCIIAALGIALKDEHGQEIACVVCGDKSSGKHYGQFTCEGKIFVYFLLYSLTLFTFWNFAYLLKQSICLLFLLHSLSLITVLLLTFWYFASYKLLQRSFLCLILFILITNSLCSLVLLLLMVLFSILFSVFELLHTTLFTYLLRLYIQLCVAMYCSLWIIFMFMHVYCWSCLHGILPASYQASYTRPKSTYFAKTWSKIASKYN